MPYEKWLVDGPKVIEIDNVRRLKVALIAGHVNIIGHDEPTARIEVAHVSGRDLKITLDGGTLEIDHPQLRWDNFIEVFRSFNGTATAEVTITVPRDVALKFGVVSSAALISGLSEDASISTVSGDVVIDNVCGDLQLNAVTGEISVRSHRGSITAHTVSGDITASGDIVTFAADTVSGDVFLDLAGAPHEVKLNSVSGSVTTRVAAGLAAQYTINTVSGRIQLDENEILGVRGSYSGRFGTLDKQWLDFRANTVSGSVSVLHAVSE